MYSLEQIEEDIKEIPKYFGKPKRIFIQGANGFTADYDVLMKTAELIHKYDGLHMTMVNMSMFTVVPGTPLYRAIEKGIYIESTEMEKLEEIYEFVKCLTNDTIFMNEHASNLFHVECRLQEQKEELLSYIRKLIEENDEKN